MENLQELNMPNAVMARLIRDSLPSGVTVSQDARQAITRAASVFVLYATSSASAIATRDGRKTLTAQDVLRSMDSMEFPEFKEPLTRFLAEVQQKQQLKKDAAAKRKQERTAAAKKGDSEDAPDQAGSSSV